MLAAQIGALAHAPGGTQRSLPANALLLGAVCLPMAATAAYRQRQIRIIADIRVLPETRAHMHIQRNLGFLPIIMNASWKAFQLGRLPSTLAFAHPQGPVDCLHIGTAAWARTLPVQPALIVCNATLQFVVRRQLMFPSQEGLGTYIDLRITAVPYLAEVVNHLAEQERQKRQQYVRAVVKPVIISTLGHLASDAHALFSLSLHRCMRDRRCMQTLHGQLLTLTQPSSSHLVFSYSAAPPLRKAGQARLTADMQHNARHILDAQGKIAPTLASSRAEQHALLLPDERDHEPATASHAAQLPPSVLLHQSTAIESMIHSAPAPSLLPPLSSS
eukprot:4742077-Amphidinium_carterae.2